MFPCPSCCFPNSEQARLCGHCGLYLKPIGDYVLSGRIGTGGFAEVYRATNRYTGHSAAIKLLHRKLSDDKEVEQRFLREVEILKELRSPNVVQIYDYGILEDLGLYLVMEWIDGTTLDVYLREQPHKRIAFQEVIPLFSQLLYGLSHIHEHQVVHRDLKPKNFMVVREKEKQILKILDFGIAWVSGGQDLTERGMFVGSTYFMAPEQFKAQKEYFGPSTDLYVAGQLLVWMLTGKHVFTANTLQALAIRHCVEPPPLLAQLNPQVPFAAELESVVSKALQKKAADRFPNAMEFLAAFQKVIPLQIRTQQSADLAWADTQPCKATAVPHTPSMQPNFPKISGPHMRVGPIQTHASPNTQNRPSSGGAIVQERPSFGPSSLPPLAAAPFPQLQAPSVRELRLSNHAHALKKTPLYPLKALHQQTSQHDSDPGLFAEHPLRVFQRKTSKKPQPLLPRRSNWKKGFIWGLVVAGLGFLLAGIVLFVLPLFGVGLPPLPLTPPETQTSSISTNSVQSSKTHKRTSFSSAH